MTHIKSLHVFFDGNVLRPESTVGLEAGKHYILSVESIQKNTDVEKDPVFDLSSLAVKTNISDLSTEHDHYLYGAPKRGSKSGK